MTTRATFLIAIGLVAVAASGWTAYAFQRDVAASRDRLSGASQIVQTRHGPIEYARSGPASAQGPVVLVVHGAGGGFDQGLGIAQPLIGRGYALVAPSRFAYLRTPPATDASPMAQADAFVSLLDELGIEKAAVFGVSAGGPSALQFAMRHPERCSALILMVPLAYLPPEAAAAAPRLSTATERVLLTIVGSDFGYWLATKVAPGTVYRTVMGTPPEVVAAAAPVDQQRVRLFMDSILPISERVQGIMADAQLHASLTRPDYDKVKMPALIISARDDLYGTFAPSKYTAQQIAGAKFLGFERGGHMLVGHDDKVAAEIDALLKSVSVAGLPASNSP